MKKWNKPELTELSIRETAGDHRVSSNFPGNTKPCHYDSSVTCNAATTGYGPCGSCPGNPDNANENSFSS